MSIFEICLLAIGLAMDCFAVSIASGIAYGRFNWIKIVRMAIFFGLFQALMPLVGWSLGVNFNNQITAFDHWLAFGILAYIGGKMIYNSLKEIEVDIDANSPFGSLKKLIILSFATSIDALATGIIFIPYNNLIFNAILVIGIASAIFTVLGVFIGVRFGSKFKLNVELIGGVILVGIGTKILIEHLCG